MKISPSLSIVSTSPGGGEGGSLSHTPMLSTSDYPFWEGLVGRRGWMYGGDGAFPWGRTG